MDVNIANNSDAEIKELLRELFDELYSGDKGADINKVMLYTPLIQMYQSELSGRQVERTTGLALRIAGFGLAVSFVSLIVVFTGRG